jgi:hypothetical protein
LLVYKPELSPYKARCWRARSSLRSSSLIAFGLIGRSDLAPVTSAFTPIRKPPPCPKIAQIQSPYSYDTAAPGDNSAIPAPVEPPSDASLVPFDRLDRSGEGHIVGLRSSPASWTPSAIAFRRIHSQSDGVAGRPCAGLVMVSAD